jgi:hypothetical protein
VRLGVGGALEVFFRKCARPAVSVSEGRRRAEAILSLSLRGAGEEGSTAVGRPGRP